MENKKATAKSLKVVGRMGVMKKKFNNQKKGKSIIDIYRETSVSPLLTTIKWENPRNKPVPKIPVIIKEECDKT
jgi:hypothetical protein